LQVIKIGKNAYAETLRSTLDILNLIH